MKLLMLDVIMKQMLGITVDMEMTLLIHAEHVVHSSVAAVRISQLSCMGN